MAPPPDGTTCTFEQCFCRWRTRCSPRIPRVAPGRDYENMLAGADDGPAWSLLVGFLSMISAGNSRVRLHRFRVARSGRVLGRSGDALEIFDDVDYDAKDASSHISDVTATPGPDGCSLCLFCKERWLADLKHHTVPPPPRPLQLHLNLGAGDGRIAVSPLPGLPPELEPVMPTRPISAAGDLWAPYLTKHYGPSRLVMLRLDKDAGLWAEVAAIDLPPKIQRLPGLLAGRVLHGYAVVGRTILLSLLPSLQPDHLFFTFDCSTHTLAAVVTTEARKTRYTPIHGRGVYVEEDDTIYFLSGSFVCAYKLCQDQGQYRMALPTKVDRLCPFGEEGYGFLTYLGSRVMCAVWISVCLHCNCDALHVVITTFRVEGNSGSNHEAFVPKGVQILHSTCRQLDMLPSKPSDSSEFCFLQEYKEFDHASSILPQKRFKHHAMAPSMLLQGMDVGTSSNVVTSACCRDILNGIAYSPSVMLDESVIRTNKAMYIICQEASYSTVYKITILDGRLACQGETLTPHCTIKAFVSDDKYDLMKHPLPCHFACESNFIYVVPSKGNELYMCSLHSGGFMSFPTSKPDDFHSIAHVLHIGSRIIAISDSLEYVYQWMYPDRWVQHSTHGPFNQKGKVNLSGYVVMGEDSFIVCDADTGFYFLFDLIRDRWTSVSRGNCSGSGLTGRSVYVEGFIYTCTDGGLAAYEITELGGTYYLGDKINLPFSWHVYWERDRMCFDYVGKDTVSGVLMFSVVQGGDYGCRCDSPDNHPIYITTVQVKTEPHKDKLKPLIVGHVDIGTSFIKRNSRNVRTCFCVLSQEKSRHGWYTRTVPPARCSVSSVHQPTLKIFCKANEGYCLAIHDGTLVLAPSDSCDEHQHWLRDMRLSTAVKDEEGNPVFSLVNKATGLAIKHSLGPYHPVRLVKFNPDNYDESLLWTESSDLGKNFGCIRMMHDISLGLDALHGGGMQVSSTTIVLSEWAKSDTQCWKILYWDDEANATCCGLYTMPSCRIYSKADNGFSVTICNGTVCLMPTNHADKCQHWIMDTRYQSRIKDAEGYSAFALVNRCTDEAIKCSDKDHRVELVPYNPNYLDKSVLWTESCDLGHGFQCIRMLEDVRLNLQALFGEEDHVSKVLLRRWCELDSQCWKIVQWCKCQPDEDITYTTTLPIAIIPSIPPPEAREAIHIFYTRRNRKS